MKIALFLDNISIFEAPCGFFKQSDLLKTSSQGDGFQSDEEAFTVCVFYYVTHDSICHFHVSPAA